MTTPPYSRPEKASDEIDDLQDEFQLLAPRRWLTPETISQVTSAFLYILPPLGLVVLALFGSKRVYLRRLEQAQTKAKSELDGLGDVGQALLEDRENAYEVTQQAYETVSDSVEVMTNITTLVLVIVIALFCWFVAYQINDLFVRLRMNHAETLGIRSAINKVAEDVATNTDESRSCHRFFNSINHPQLREAVRTTLGSLYGKGTIKIQIISHTGTAAVSMLTDSLTRLDPRIREMELPNGDISRATVEVSVVMTSPDAHRYSNVEILREDILERYYDIAESINLQVCFMYAASLSGLVGVHGARVVQGIESKSSSNSEEVQAMFLGLVEQLSEHNGTWEARNFETSYYCMLRRQRLEGDNLELEAANNSFSGWWKYCLAHIDKESTFTWP